MCAVSRLLALISAVLLLAGGCAHYPDNPSLASIDQRAGYRYSVVREEPTADKPFVLLSFSGGGTRAAAFSFGLMEELRNVEYTSKEGSKRRLMDDVEIICNIQRELAVRLISPYNWFRLLSPDFSRIDMADEYYNETIFEKKTFAHLLKQPKGSVPFLVLNATDIGIAHRFEFTQDQFDLLCSDLSGVSVSRAVAASSNFPVAFAPLTLNIYRKTAGAALCRAGSILRSTRIKIPSDAILMPVPPSRTAMRRGVSYTSLTGAFPTISACAVRIRQ